MPAAIVQRILVPSLAASILGTSPLAAQTINIWPGAAPGSESWTQQEKTYKNTPVGTVIQNVVTPTITAYLPARAKATGTAVIIAPGGGFIALATTLEGEGLARYLQQRGIAAFLLKYRTIEQRGSGIPQMDQDTAARYGIADAIQALKVVREHAAEWHLARNRVGIIGFSAGGMVASGALLQPDSAGRPDFAAMIYGAPFGVMPAIPAKLPPVFLAWAADDNVVPKMLPRFRDALVAAGISPEVHVYAKGGHGFGMKKQGTTSDHWVDEFYWWLDAQGLAKKARAAR
ncbi:MAG TPA: alpha/beta hydrolase [Gemmatimonadaceae bacterium]|nr:alpha/beta hydrolase [Gemmatimonadaceae bacterium]